MSPSRISSPTCAPPRPRRPPRWSWRERTNSSPVSIGWSGACQRRCRRGQHRLESRLRALESRSGFAGMRGHLALRGRHADELTFELRRAAASRHGVAGACLPALAPDARTIRSAPPSGRCQEPGSSRAMRACTPRFTSARTRSMRGSAASAARLDSLSPLAVLGRGYAVCWNADRTEIIRDAARVGQRLPVSS